MALYDVNGNIAAKNQIRVCGLNVGNFANGASGDPSGTDSMYNKFIETFRECNADIYSFSEWDKYWSGSVTSLDTLGFLKPHKSTYLKEGSGVYAGQMIYSDYPIQSEAHQNYTVDPEYYFLDDAILICGKLIHVISTHFTWKTEANRRSQIAQVLKYLSDNNIESYIIAGDMNLGLHGNDSQPQDEETKFAIARRDVTQLESGGGASAQGGKWGNKDRDGFINTAGHTSWDAQNINMFDNIVISPDIRFENVFTVITEATDHDALCADLVIT